MESKKIKIYLDKKNIIETFNNDIKFLSKNQNNMILLVLEIQYYLKIIKMA